MLNAIVRKLNGHGAEAASLEAAILQLGRDREETRASIEELRKRRHGLLLDDASDADIDKIERLIDRAEVRLEKLNAAEPPLVEKLTAARSAARAKRWGELRSAYTAAAAAYLEAARAAMHKYETLVACVAQAQGEGFAGEAAARMPPAPAVAGSALLAPNALDIFEREVTPRPAVMNEKLWVTRAPRVPAPKAPDSLQHEVRLAGGVPLSRNALRAKRAPDDMSPLKSGQVRVRVLRNGYSPADDQPQCHVGQLVVMSRNKAQTIAAAGVIEILEDAGAAGPGIIGAVTAGAAEAHKSNAGESP